MQLQTKKVLEQFTILLNENNDLKELMIELCNKSLINDNDFILNYDKYFGRFSVLVSKIKMNKLNLLSKNDYLELAFSYRLLFVFISVKKLIPKEKLLNDKETCEFLMTENIYFILTKIKSIKSNLGISNKNFFTKLETQDAIKVALLENSMEDEFKTTKILDKIILLNETGVIDLLTKKQPFNTSTNSLAKYLSFVIGEKQTSIQSCLNALISNSVENKNNPYNSDKAVKRNKDRLINIGFNLD